jgi:hypothetical protein
MSRIEIFPLRTGRQQWGWRVRSANRRKVATAGEGFHKPWGAIRAYLTHERIVGAAGAIPIVVVDYEGRTIRTVR